MPSLDLARLFERARSADGSADVAARALPLVDLTSLTGGETAADIERLCRRAMAHGVAAVCIYPRHVSQAKELLRGSPVRLATVANFPHGDADILPRRKRRPRHLPTGADEVDVVAPIAAIQEGDVGLVGELVEACRAGPAPAHTLKIILETGVLQQPELISAAARAAIMAGVGFLKTSTGKTPVSATLEAAATLLTVMRRGHGRVGFKAAGGIRTTKDAAGYLQLADDLLGRAWASPHRFRFGASALLDDLLRVLGHADGDATATGYDRVAAPGDHPREAPRPSAERRRDRASSAWHHGPQHR